MNLTERISRIRTILHKPYYFFYKTSNNEIMIRFENKKQETNEFRGRSMHDAINVAEDYINNEIKAGTLEDIKEETQKADEKPENQ